jgi:hypothetical protein
MAHYAITVSPDEAGREFEVLLRGPGIDPEGRRYVFATTHRCATFAQAVNFAYGQGFRDGLRKTVGDNIQLPARRGARPRLSDPGPKAIQDLCERALRMRVKLVESELEIGFAFVKVARCAATTQATRKALGKARTARDSAIASFHLVRVDLPESEMNLIVERLRELERSIAGCPQRPSASSHRKSP